MQHRGVYWYIIGSVTCSTNPDRRVAGRTKQGVAERGNGGMLAGNWWITRPPCQTQDGSAIFKLLLFLYKYYYSTHRNPVMVPTMTDNKIRTVLIKWFIENAPFKILFNVQFKKNISIFNVNVSSVNNNQCFYMHSANQFYDSSLKIIMRILPDSF